MTIASEKQHYLPFVESNPAASVDELKGQLEENSYLFFRGLVPKEVVLSVRRSVLEVCQKAGWLDAESELMDGIVAGRVKPTQEGKADYAEVYRKVLHLPDFHDFPNHPNLLTIVAKLLSIKAEEVLVHPRRIGRLSFPSNFGATTPPHQDYYYIRGSVDTLSCWAPLGDCPVELGGLAMLPGSHRGGYREHTVKFPGAVGGVGLKIDDATTVWHTGDFGVGDAIFFHTYTIHKAMPNLTANLLRVSTDNRYQRPQDRIEPDALLPHASANPDLFR